MADPLTWQQVVFALLGGGLAGGAVSSAVTSWHERNERRKSRRIDAADDYVKSITDFRHELEHLRVLSKALTRMPEHEDVTADDLVAGLHSLEQMAAVAGDLPSLLLGTRYRSARLAIVFPRETGVYEAALEVQTAHERLLSSTAKGFIREGTAVRHVYDRMSEKDRTTKMSALAQFIGAADDVADAETAAERTEATFLDLAEAACR
jgi:hypothetical protein